MAVADTAALADTVGNLADPTLPDRSSVGTAGPEADRREPFGTRNLRTEPVAHARWSGSASPHLRDSRGGIRTAVAVPLPARRKARPSKLRRTSTSS